MTGADEDGASPEDIADGGAVARDVGLEPHGGVIEVPAHADRPDRGVERGHGPGQPRA
jgi:hypothetical protein